MIDFELEELNENDDWLVLLQAYSARREARQMPAKTGPHLESVPQEENDGWVPRLTSVEGIVEERLSKIHGKLIALGLLKFQLAGRERGVRYQVSALGKQALERKGAVEDESNDPALDQMDAA